jgi:hypothetical protein
METPSPSYVITRALFLIALLVAILYGYGAIKKHQRKNAIYTDLQSITSDSSFFQQFYAEDARKSLCRAIGLIAEAGLLGTDPDETINRGLGIEPKFFDTDADHDEPPAREEIIRACLRNNYDNFLKLGYTADFHTLEALKNGELPPIPSGPHSGSKPVIANLISPEFSPGMDKVIANLEIRPPQDDDHKPTDIELAAARELARKLSYAGIIETPAMDRILKSLETPTP